MSERLPDDNTYLESLLETARSSEDAATRNGAANELFSHLASTVNSAIRRFENRPHDVNDLAQDTAERLTKAVINNGAYLPGTLRGYVTRVATNRCIDVKRREARIRFEQDDHLEYLPGRDDTAAAVIDNSSGERVKQLLVQSGATTSQVEAVYLFHIEGLSYQEVADTLGIPIGTVRSSISRGLAKVRKANDINDDTKPYDLFEDLSAAS